MNGHQPDILAPIVALIAERRRALDQLEQALASYQEAFAGAQPAAPASVATSRRTPVAGGSVPDRILGLLKEAGEPVALSVLLSGAKAKPGAVRASVAELIEARRVVKTGASRSTRYALAK